MLALLLPLVAAPAQDAPPPVRPNVLLLISDDQAWADFGFLDHPVIETPRLDELAAESSVFERGYVPTSLCRASLATMITGLFPHEHKITGNDPPKGVAREELLRHIEAVPTLPRLLAPLGYRSLQTGKWWEGNCKCGGFDEGMTHGEPARGGRHGDEGLKIGRDTLEPIWDFVDACAEAEAPFFVWYAPFLPHTPHNPPERLLARYRDRVDSIHVARYYAMCTWLDETCGALLDGLEERGIADETLVLFVVDNGWIQRENARGYAPRSKRSPYEGGVRTPILARLPGRAPAARVDALASSVDLAPTVLRACGADVPEAMGGRDLIAIARGEAPARSTVFGATFTHDMVEVDRPAAGLRTRWIAGERWKLIRFDEDGGRSELYDLVRDPWERHDLAAAQPAQVARLTAEIEAWWSPGE